MVFCGHCGKDFSFRDLSFCPTCGKPWKNVSEFSSPKPTKNPGTALAIAILAGAVSFNGVGHLYCGKVRKGIKLLIVGWILFALTILLPSLGIIYFVFWIWQAHDAYKITKQNNEYMSKNGRVSW
jgi:TM2 domain-containing membrane protein YozV